MKKWSGFFVLGLLWPGILQAQQVDTLLQLQVVEVQALPQAVGRQPALHILAPDSVLSRHLVAGSVADWLSWQGPVSLRSHGPAGLASVSVRGGSSQQSGLLWDGMSLQNPMNSTPDMNLLPLWLFGDVHLQLGSAVSDFGSGAIGGALHLGQSVPQQAALSFFTEARSFGDYAGGWAATHRGKNWWASSRGIARQAANNFPYTNTAAFNQPVERLSNSQTGLLGSMHELGWQPNAQHRLRLHWWHQANRRELPPSMTTARSEAIQADTADRILLSWQFGRGPWGIALRNLLSNELNHYYDRLTNLDERHQVLGLLQELQMHHCGEGPHQFSLLVQHAWYQAQSPNLLAGTQQQRFALVPAWMYATNKRRLQLRSRVEWLDGQLLPLTPSLQWEERLKGKVALHAALSRNYRVPTLNDLYWQPGGNPNLLPEQGWSSEMALKYHKTAGNSRLETRMGLFFTDVQNWIVWIPNPQLGYWSPQNLRRVRSQGIESSLNLQHKKGQYQFHFQADYSYVHSTNRKVQPGDEALLGRQLIYVPRHQLRGRLFVKRQGWHLGWQFSTIGQRYTTADNQHFIPPYELSSLLAGGDLKLGKPVLRISAGINNLFNQQYQAVAYRPMPGRNFHLNLTLNIN
ncbi:MAG: TonB-dependent receptor [Bacteroidia bacterium]